MQKQIWVAALVAVSGLFVGCQGNGTGGLGGGPSAKVYDYTAYNGSGEPIVKGVMSFDHTTPTKFTGKWNFRKVRREEAVGPQVGRGNLSGGLSRGRLTVSLTSDPTKGNVRLTGSASGDRFDGDWVWHGRSGNALNRGKFLAQLRR